MNVLKEIESLPVYVNVRYLPQLHLCLISEITQLRFRLAKGDYGNYINARLELKTEIMGYNGDLKNLELITSMFNSGIFDKKTDVIISDYFYTGADHSGFGFTVVSEDEAQRLGFINYDRCPLTLHHAYHANENSSKGAFYRYRQDSNAAIMRILKGELDYEAEQEIFTKAYSELLSGFEVKGNFSLYSGDAPKKRNDGEILIPCQFILDIVDGKTTLDEVSEKIRAIA